MEASIDNVSSAPDGMSVGDKVIVLFDPTHPGHALFPSQLGWGTILFPGLGFTVVGLAASAAGGLAAARRIRARRSR
ncbi:hypothetical protein [Kitasatospora sp. MAP12-22]|uniref:hypothetical protein n=1 Tax=Kitasatospora sp. MAP12-22 TaxID=3156301 RepID=UPI003514B7F2